MKILKDQFEIAKTERLINLIIEKDREALRDTLPNPYADDDDENLEDQLEDLTEDSSKI